MTEETKTTLAEVATAQADFARTASQAMIQTAKALLALQVQIDNLDKRLKALNSWAEQQERAKQQTTM